jgi:hypothetical protein
MEKLILRAKHFKGTNFVDFGNCALVKAAKEHFKREEFIEERINFMDVGSISYRHRRYGDDEFTKDKKKAKELRYSNQIMKKIILKEQKQNT